MGKSRGGSQSLVRTPEDRLELTGEGNARLANWRFVVAEEAAAALDANRQGISSGSAAPAWPSAAIELGLSGISTLVLPPVTEDVPLDLVETRTLGSRVIYECYGRARDQGN